MDGERQSLMAYRLRSIRVGVQATFLVLVGLFAYAFIPSHVAFDSRTLYMGVLVLAAAGAVLVWFLPWERLFERGWGMPAMYAWSVLDIVLIAILIGTSGGDASPLHLLFGLTTVFFSASYPPRAQVALLAFTFGCYFVALQVSEAHIVTATLVLRFGILASLTYITSFLARELINRNVALEASVARHAETEDRLREREADLEHAQRVAHLGSWNWDLTNNRIAWSDELFRIYGLEPDQPPRDFASLLLRVHEDDRERLWTTVQRALDEESSFALEHRLVRPDGSVRDVLASGRVESSGDAPGCMVGTVLDITEQKHAEAADRELRELRTRRQQAVEINDNVVQGLAVASYALDAGDGPRAKAAIEKTLAAARSIINELLDVDALEPGDLVRSKSAHVLAEGSPRGEDDSATREASGQDSPGAVPRVP